MNITPEQMIHDRETAISVLKILKIPYPIKAIAAINEIENEQLQELDKARDEEIPTLLQAFQTPA